MTPALPPEKRLASWLPFAAAVIVPLTILGVMGVFSFEQTRHQAELRAQRAVQALAEHALRTFRAHDLIINAVDKYIAGWSWDEIDASPRLHDFFKGLMRNADDINTIFVIGPTGREGNSSLIFPLPPADMTGRPFYEELRRQGGLHLSDPDIGRMNKQRFFSFTRRRSAPADAFDGVISVSVNPAYFEKFYANMVEGAADSVGLVRADGRMLVRVPVVAAAENVTLRNTPGGLVEAMQSDALNGTFSLIASVDGVQRIYAYRRVGDYPLYATYGLSYHTVWSAWRRNMLAYAVVCLTAMGLLVTAAVVVRGHHRREAEVVSRYAQESARRMAAEDMNRSKDEFLAALSHELRNPLSSIAASVEILRRVDASDPRGARSVEIIARQIDHLRRLLGDLLDVARSVYGKMNLDLRIIAPLDVAASVAASYSGVIRQQVKIAVGGARAWVRADPTRLRQMIENLVDNAHKYGATNIDVRVDEGADCVELAVDDNGDGIAAELLPNLFEPFVQGKQPLDRTIGGLGLGLALVQRLAVAHGGTLAVRSDGPGKGSTFVIRLPKSPPPQSPPLAIHAAVPAQARVLVIEDQQDARDSLRMLLEMDQHDVETAANGSEGLAKFESFAPTVVLVDIGLPEMNGYDVARVIRSREHGRRTWLIAVTGYGRPHDLTRSREAGFDCHLMKPVSYEDLKKLLITS